MAVAGIWQRFWPPGARSALLTSGSPHNAAFSAELLSRCGRQIGTVLATLTNALNPQLIVIGGEVAETGDILLAAIRETVYRRSYPLVTRDLRIVRSQMLNSAGLVGSALTLTDTLFSAAFLEGWISSGVPLHHPEIAALIARSDSMQKAKDKMPGPPTVMDEERGETAA